MDKTQLSRGSHVQTQDWQNTHWSVLLIVSKADIAKAYQIQKNPLKNNESQSEASISPVTSIDQTEASITPVTSTDQSEASIAPVTSTDQSEASISPVTSIDQSEASIASDPCASRMFLTISRQVPHWSREVTWPEYCPLIGREESRDLNTGLWLTASHYLQTGSQPALLS